MSDDYYVNARIDMERERLLRLAAPLLLEALEEAEKELTICRMNIAAELRRGVERWEGVPAILDARINHIRTAIAAARGASEGEGK